MTSIAIIDYEVGNIRSIVSAIEKVGAKPKLTRNPKDILDADGTILPGVGAFSHGMKKLNDLGLDEVIKDFAATGKPLLGICLGMQLLLTYSEEFGHTEGLGLIPGTVKKLNLVNERVQKLPHVSWSEIYVPNGISWNNTILNDISPNEDMYFVHSFMAIPENEKHILAFSKYSNSQFCSSIKSGNVYGCQFHPEKSAEEGLKIINNFISICED